MCDADYQGKYAVSTCYNSEEGVTLAEMTESETDWAVIFNIADRGRREGKGDFTGVQRRAGSRRTQGQSPYTAYVPDPQQPAWLQHGTGR